MSRREMVVYGICIILILYVLICTVEVYIHNANPDTYTYNKANVYVLMTAHTTDMKVVTCQAKGKSDFDVTVQDIEGNLWSYIDSEQRQTGTIIRITMSGNEIVNAK